VRRRDTKVVVELERVAREKLLEKIAYGKGIEEAKTLAHKYANSPKKIRKKGSANTFIHSPGSGGDAGRGRSPSPSGSRSPGGGSPGSRPGSPLQHRHQLSPQAQGFAPAFMGSPLRSPAEGGGGRGGGLTPALAFSTPSSQSPVRGRLRPKSAGAINSSSPFATLDLGFGTGSRSGGGGGGGCRGSGLFPTHAPTGYGSDSDNGEGKKMRKSVSESLVRPRPKSAHSKTRPLSTKAERNAERQAREHHKSRGEVREKSLVTSRPIFHRSSDRQHSLLPLAVGYAYIHHPTSLTMWLNPFTPPSLPSPLSLPPNIVNCTIFDTPTRRRADTPAGQRPPYFYQAGPGPSGAERAGGAGVCFHQADRDAAVHLHRRGQHTLLDPQVTHLLLYLLASS
jgi:hypothetical protein